MMRQRRNAKIQQGSKGASDGSKGASDYAALRAAHRDCRPGHAFGPGVRIAARRRSRHGGPSGWLWSSRPSTVACINASDCHAQFIWKNDTLGKSG